MRACELHAADRQPGDVESRLSDAHWHALSGLAARAHALVEREVIAHHFHPRQRARPFAYQRRALDRRFDLAVLNEVGLGALKHELAGGDVDLTAPEIDRVNPAIEAAQDLL